MIIPNKHSGYQAGIRLYPMGGGGGGSSQPGMGDSQVGNTGGTTGVGTGISVPPPPAWSNMAVNTEQGYNTLQSMRGVPWEKSGTAYNELLNQGFTSNQIRDSASQMYGKPSDSNWSGMVQNAGMTSPTGRPMAGSDQFYQPIYQSQYQNYNMGNPMGVSRYGQNMGGFGGFGGMGGGGSSVNSTTTSDMMGGRRGPAIPFGQVMSQLGFGGLGGGMPQMQSPFMPQQNQPQMNWQTGQMQQPAQQPMQQPQMPPYMAMGGFGGFGGMGGSDWMSQMQSPYSYQQPIQQQMQQPARPNYGPSQAIISRSAQMRGTPNVMRRAEGGIASLMDDE